MDRSYQICVSCVMDTSAQEIVFDNEGKCNFCLGAEALLRNRVSRDDRMRRLKGILTEIRRFGRGQEFDCVVGLSGGCDSSYLVYQLVQFDLRPLVVHFDSGWNTELATQNIERLVTGLNLDLHTVVCDWDEMRDLQRSYFKARVVNADTPQDHAFMATLMQVATEENVRYWVTGHDGYGSESILPLSWRGYTSADWVNIRATHEAMGGRPLKRYPHYSYTRQSFVEPYIRRRKMLSLFALQDYDKQKAKLVLERELGWRDYSGKHNESVLTRFLQGYYQPNHLGFDKRRAHLSSLVATGQLKREQALVELQAPFYTPSALREDLEHVLRKLNFTEEEWRETVSRPVRDAREFKNSEWYIENSARVVRSAGNVRRTLKGAGRR